MTVFFRSKIFVEIVVYAVLAIVAFSIAHFARSGNSADVEENRESVAGVSVLTVEPRTNIQVPYTTNGPVAAEQSTDIQSVVPGTVLSLLPVGTNVTQGSVLFRLSNPGIEQGYFAAISSLVNAEGSASQSGFVTESQLEEARIRATSAELSLRQAEQSLVDAEISATLSIKQAEDASSVAYDAAYRTVETAMRFLGGPNLDGFIFDNVTSNYIGGVGQLKNQFDTAVVAFKQTSRFTDSNLIPALQKLESTLGSAKDFSQSAWTYLRLAVPNPFYSESQINTAVNSVGVTIDSLNASDTQLKNARNNLQAAREQANASLASLRTQIKVAETALANARQSLQTQTANSRVASLGSQNQVNAARSQLASVQYQYDNLSLNSPFAGTVISHGVTLGSQVNPGQKLLTLGNLEIVEIKIEVTPEVAQALKLGQEVGIEGGRSGRISEIEAAGSLATGNIGVTINADNSNNQFIPGNSVQVTLNLVYDVPETYIVPISAVTITQTESYVLLAEQGKVVKRKVITGKVFGESIEIASGLSSGDSVIISSPGLLQEGKEIEIKN